MQGQVEKGRESERILSLQIKATRGEDCTHSSCDEKSSRLTLCQRINGTVGVQEGVRYNLKSAKSHWKINSMVTQCGQMKTERSLAMSCYFTYAGRCGVGFLQLGRQQGLDIPGGENEKRKHPDVGRQDTGVKRTANFLWEFAVTLAQPVQKPPRCVHGAIAQIFPSYVVYILRGSSQVNLLKVTLTQRSENFWSYAVSLYAVLSP